MGGDGQEIEVGDTVDVPGGMHGVVKFIGSVRGKKGVFGGVELSREYAVRGKNDGDVDGYVHVSSRYTCPRLIVSKHTILHNLCPRRGHLPPYTSRYETLFAYIDLRDVSSHPDNTFFFQLQPLYHRKAQFQS
jgi:hypothetical protein